MKQKLTLILLNRNCSYMKFRKAYKFLKLVIKFKSNKRNYLPVIFIKFYFTFNFNDR